MTSITDIVFIDTNVVFKINTTLVSKNKNPKKNLKPITTHEFVKPIKILF
jgi:hypothetical protein